MASIYHWLSMLKKLSGREFIWRWDSLRMNLMPILVGQHFWHGKMWVFSCYYRSISVTSIFTPTPPIAFWNWKRWEQKIGWMAVPDINVPLAFSVQESMWQKVWFYSGWIHFLWASMFCMLKRKITFSFQLLRPQKKHVFQAWLAQIFHFGRFLFFVFLFF